MNQKLIKRDAVGRAMVYVAAFIVIVAGIGAGKAVIVPFLLALLFSMICAPPAFWLKRHGMPMPLALTLILLVLIIVQVAFGAMITRMLTSFTASLPFYQARLWEWESTIRAYAAAHDISLGDTFGEMVNTSAILGLVRDLLANVGRLLGQGFVITLVVFFLLLETASFEAKLNWIYRRLGKEPPDFVDLVQVVNRYMLFKTLISLMTGVCVWIGLTLMKIDFALMWGLLAFLLNFIPTIGSIIAALPAVLLAFVQVGVGGAIGVALLYLGVNVLFGNIVEPRVVGRGVGMSPLVVLLSILFWGWLLGPVGMILSVPLTMSIKIALGTRPETEAISVLIGRGIPEDEPPLQQDAKNE